MPKVEIEEADLIAQKGVVDSVKAILANPKSREMLLRAQKIVKPDASIPEIDAKEPVLEELAKFREEMAEDRKARAAEAAKVSEEKRLNDFRANWDRQKLLVRERYPDLNDNGLEEIEKLAQERGIPDLEASAALFRQLHPPAVPESPGAGGWNFFDQPQDNLKEQMEKLMQSRGESEPALNALTREALDAVRGQRRAA